MAHIIVFVLVGKESSKGEVVPKSVRGLLEEYLTGVFPEDLPKGLLPLRDIQRTS
jgi:hypothetical protein